MSAGLFVVSCPHCETELKVDELGAGPCAGCGRAYLTRFGHLIEVDLEVAVAIAPEQDSAPHLAER